MMKKKSTIMDPRDMLEINSINLMNKLDLQNISEKIKTII